MNLSMISYLYTDLKDQMKIYPTNTNLYNLVHDFDFDKDLRSSK